MWKGHSLVGLFSSSLLVVSQRRCFTRNVIHNILYLFHSEWEWNFYGVSDKDQKWPQRKAINDKIAPRFISISTSFLFAICPIYRLACVLSPHCALHCIWLSSRCKLFNGRFLWPVDNEKCLHLSAITWHLFWHSFKLLLSDWCEWLVINFFTFHHNLQLLGLEFQSLVANQVVIVSVLL